MTDWQIIEGDCLDVLGGWCADFVGDHPPPPQIDHIITDPPYEAQAHTSARRSRHKTGIGVEHIPIPFACIDERTRELIGCYSRELVSGWALAFCQVEAAGKWAAVFGDGYRRTMVWIKPDSAPQFTGDRPGQGYECISVAWCGEGRSKWNGGGRRGVLTHTIGVHGGHGAGRYRNDHPTTKPLPLMLELLELFTSPGELVVDPFCGSGSTGVAAIRLGRRFIGIEIDPTYAELARERLEAEVQGLDLRAARAGQMSLFGGNDG